MRLEIYLLTCVAWRQEKGDAEKLDELVGQLEGLYGGRTRATYRLEVVLGRMLGTLNRGPVEDKLRGDPRRQPPGGAC